ncbi:MAG: hypothetical protein LBS73_07220 [Campylobacteraceae bacterium]|jgi:hypothetical protein|nr:hypothetical protein [Campylobacteraceae bacterium]
MSTQESNAALDEYHIKLKNEGDILTECQKSKSLESCFECDKIFECDVRKKYVKAVYESMSHGQGGGFEF